MAEGSHHYTITVHEPNVHQNHWGVDIRSFGHAERQSIPDCERITRHVEKVAKLLGYHPFHQGGHHLWDEKCGGWHYFEFWSLSGDEDHRQAVENFIKALYDL